MKESKRIARAKAAGRTMDEQLLLDQIGSSRGTPVPESEVFAILEMARAMGDLEQLSPEEIEAHRKDMRAGMDEAFRLMPAAKAAALAKKAAEKKVTPRKRGKSR